LRSYVEAMGGRLRLVVEFPHREPVVLSDLNSLGASTKAAPRKGKKQDKDAAA